MAPHPSGEGALGCTGLALILTIEGMGTPFWISASAGPGSISLGLFLTCVNVYGDKNNMNCSAIEDPPGWLIGCRATSVMSLLAILAALASGALVVLNNPDNTVLKMVPPAAALAGAVLGAISVAIFANKFDVFDVGSLGPGIGLGYDYSFYLAIVAIVLSGAACGLFIVSRRFASAY